MELSIGYELFLLSAFIGAIMVVVCYERSSAFRYKFKFAVYTGMMSLIGLCMIPFCVIRPKNVKNLSMSVPFVRTINKLLGIHWEVSGKEILAKDFPCVVIANHQSVLDVLAVNELLPTMKKCACIAKKEIFYVFPFGIWVWLCGTIYINRRNPTQSQMTLSTSAEKIREEKTKMWIFPEGTRTKGEELLAFKKGAFHIALSQKLPIVPVVLSPYTFIDDDKQIFEAGVMKIKVLEPIDTSAYKYPEDVSKLMETCYDVMNKEFQRLKEEMKSDELNERFSNAGTSYSIKGTSTTAAHANGLVTASVTQSEEKNRISSR